MGFIRIFFLHLTNSAHLIAQSILYCSVYAVYTVDIQTQKNKIYKIFFDCLILCILSWKSSHVS